MKANSKWIWPTKEVQADQYGEFYQPFEYSGEKAELRISADSNYAVYVNGKLATSDQYPDYPHYKVYDVIDLTPFCEQGVSMSCGWMKNCRAVRKKERFPASAASTAMAISKPLLASWA